jgi:Domain of unknown function (DUF5109)
LLIYGVLSTSTIDIINMQDGIGVGHATTENVGSWFSGMKNMISSAHPSTQLWATIETFTDTGTGYVSANQSRILDPINAEKAYVSKFSSFSFTAYQSPQAGHTSQYLDYKIYATQP